MPVEEGKIAYIGKVDGKFKLMAKVLGKHPDAKRPWYKRDPWKSAAMLWGDVVFVRKIQGSKAEVSAKGHVLEIPKRHLTDKPLLNIWQIDVGQGDASLIRFPDGRWAMIDMGPGRSGMINTNSGRTGIDFVKWVAFQDCCWMFEGAANKDKPFHFDWVAFSHPDDDHIGGALEFVTKLGTWWSVGTVYHCGLGRIPKRDAAPWKKWQSGSNGFSQLGEIEGPSEDELYITPLIDGFDDYDTYSKPAPGRNWALGGNWGKILAALRDKKGTAVGKLKRLSDRSDGSELSSGDISAVLLGPIETTVPGTTRSGLRYLDTNSTSGFYNLGGPSLSRNGHSLVIRFDMGDVRLLMTGDLNFKSQALLLQRWDASEFKCHVGKACHHGSDDISWQFLAAMAPVATMFSSGDQESHVHPRALVLGMTGALSPRLKWNKPDQNGVKKIVTQEFNGFEEEVLYSPLLYSTELSRSVLMGAGYGAYKKGVDTAGAATYEPIADAWIKGPDENDKPVRLHSTRIIEKITYGLINVRTDGETVVMAVLEEDKENPPYHVEHFKPSELEEI